MARDIKSLLNKKGWTGEEIGRALLANLINDIKNRGISYKPLFSQADLDRMEKSLENQRDYTKYGIFINICSSVIDCFNRAEALNQQFYNGFYRYFMKLNQAYDADRALSDIENYPLIMTQSQYERIKEIALKEIRTTKTSFHAIVFDILGYYLGEYGEPEKIPTPIREALDKTKSQPVTNKRILENWNEDMGEGYHTLADGRRSDQMTSEEWREALKQEYLKIHKLTIAGEPASAEETVRHFNEQRLLRGYKILFEGVDGIKKALEETGGVIPDGITEEELIEQMEELIEDEAKENNCLKKLFSNGVNPIWHYYTEPPINLTKYDVLENLLERYSGVYSDRLLNGEFVEELNKQEQFKEFIADYPELYKALKEDIASRIPKAKGLKSNQYSKELFNWGELADLNISVYKHFTAITNPDLLDYYYRRNETTKDYSRNKRIIYKGIAILTNAKNTDIDERGDYIEKIGDPLNEYFSIDSIAEKDENIVIEIFINNLIKPALSYLYAYNAFIDIISKAYAIEDAETLKQNLTAYESKLSGLNGTLYMFYANVYGDREEKHRKRALIRDIFKPIHVDELKPAPEIIEEISEEINNLGLTQEAKNKLKDFNGYIYRLTGGGEK